MNKSMVWRLKQPNTRSGYVRGHWVRGEKNGHWKGGRFVSANGYVYLLRPDHPNALKKGTPGYIAEHRLVMSDSLGRPLASDELVHHKNGNKQDNSLDNLVLIGRAAHAREHHTGPKSATWKGGRRPRQCKRLSCRKMFLPIDKTNDHKAVYCSRECFYLRNK